MSDNSKKLAVADRHPRAMIMAVVAIVAATNALAGCSTASSTVAQPPTAKLVRMPGSSEPSVVLTQLGAERIGLETAPVTIGRDGEATLPYPALLYEPNGQTAVYVATGTLTFTRAFVTVVAIDGDTVIVKAGVAPGDRVATDGAEELLGVQNGVGEET